jgi:hypothetical protein
MILRFLVLLCLSAKFALAASPSPQLPRQTNSTAFKDPGVVATLTIARDLLDQIRRQASNPKPDLEAIDKLKTQVRQIIQDIATAFPLMEPGAKEGDFRNIVFNQSGLAVDAFRIKNTTSEPKKLAWIVGCRAEMLLDTWQVIPTKGAIKGFTKYFVVPPDTKNVPWKKLPQSHKAFCQATEQADLKPGEEYIVWFAYGSAKPKPTYLLFNLLPAETPTSNAEEILKALKVE